MTHGAPQDEHLLCDLYCYRQKVLVLGGKEVHAT